jgi:tripartite-type tricarboxylate transporter receptor subunit TctC
MVALQQAPLGEGFVGEIPLTLFCLLHHLAALSHKGRGHNNLHHCSRHGSPVVPNPLFSARVQRRRFRNMPAQPWKLQHASAMAAAIAAVLATNDVRAADFYAGKGIDLVIGSNVGGGYDIYARAIARHLPRFVPGNPAIVPKNQPGAGSGRAAAFLYSVAPKDGSVIGAVFPGAIMAALLDERAQPLYDPTRFQYLASADNATRVCISHARSQVHRLEDARHRKAIMGASAAGGSTRDYINMLRKTTGVLFEAVAGYKGTADIFLAMERGEVDGMCGLDWASLKSQRPDWLRDKAVNILVQTALEPEPELTALGVPTVWDFVRNADDRKALELILGQQVIGRPYLAPPGVPAEPVAILRKALAAMFADPEFLADAERVRIDVAPSTGERVQQLVEALYAMPKPVVERAKELIRP